MHLASPYLLRFIIWVSLPRMEKSKRKTAMKWDNIMDYLYSTASGTKMFSQSTKDAVENAYEHFCPYLSLLDTLLCLAAQGCHFLLFLHCSQVGLEDLVVLVLLVLTFPPKWELASLHVHVWMNQISTHELRRQERKQAFPWLGNSEER